jgi:hypothetical protein
MPPLRRSTLVRGILGVVEVLALVIVAAYIQHSSPPAFAISPIAICSTATHTEFPDEMSYLAQNEITVNKMMSSMAVKPTGDADRDFVSMMSPLRFDLLADYDRLAAFPGDGGALPQIDRRTSLSTQTTAVGIFGKRN